MPRARQCFYNHLSPSRKRCTRRNNSEGSLKKEHCFVSSEGRCRVSAERLQHVRKTKQSIKVLKKSSGHNAKEMNQSIIEESKPTVAERKKKYEVGIRFGGGHNTDIYISNVVDRMSETSNFYHVELDGSMTLGAFINKHRKISARLGKEKDEEILVIKNDNAVIKKANMADTLNDLCDESTVMRGNDGFNYYEVNLNIVKKSSMYLYHGDSGLVLNINPSLSWNKLLLGIYGDREAVDDIESIDIFSGGRIVHRIEDDDFKKAISNSGVKSGQAMNVHYH